MMRPLGDRLVVKRDPPPLTSHGLIVPETARDWRGDRGTVLAVGPGRKTEQGAHIPLLVKAGDIVMLPELCGVEVRIEGELYSLIREEEIVGIVHAGA